MVAVAVALAVVKGVALEVALVTLDSSLWFLASLEGSGLVLLLTTGGEVVPLVVEVTPEVEEASGVELAGEVVAFEAKLVVIVEVGCCEAGEFGIFALIS